MSPILIQIIFLRIQTKIKCFQGHLILLQWYEEDNGKFWFTLLLWLYWYNNDNNNEDDHKNNSKDFISLWRCEAQEVANSWSKYCYCCFDTVITVAKPYRICGVSRLSRFLYAKAQGASHLLYIDYHNIFKPIPSSCCCS